MNWNSQHPLDLSISRKRRGSDYYEKAPDATVPDSVLGCFIPNRDEVFDGNGSRKCFPGDRHSSNHTQKAPNMKKGAVHWVFREPDGGNDKLIGGGHDELVSDECSKWKGTPGTPSEWWFRAAKVTESERSQIFGCYGLQRATGSTGYFQHSYKVKTHCPSTAVTQTEPLDFSESSKTVPLIVDPKLEAKFISGDVLSSDYSRNFLSSFDFGGNCGRMDLQDSGTKSNCGKEMSQVPTEPLSSALTVSCSSNTPLPSEFVKAGRYNETRSFPLNKFFDCEQFLTPPTVPRSPGSSTELPKRESQTQANATAAAAAASPVTKALPSLNVENMLPTASPRDNSLSDKISGSEENSWEKTGQNVNSISNHVEKGGGNSVTATKVDRNQDTQPPAPQKRLRLTPEYKFHQRQQSIVAGQDQQKASDPAQFTKKMQANSDGLASITQSLPGGLQPGNIYQATKMTPVSSQATQNSPSFTPSQGNFPPKSSNQKDQKEMRSAPFKVGYKKYFGDKPSFKESAEFEIQKLKIPNLDKFTEFSSTRDCSNLNTPCDKCFLDENQQTCLPRNMPELTRNFYDTDSVPFQVDNSFSSLTRVTKPSLCGPEARANLKNQSLHSENWYGNHTFPTTNFIFVKPTLSSYRPNHVDTGPKHSPVSAVYGHPLLQLARLSWMAEKNHLASPFSPGVGTTTKPHYPSFSDHFNQPYVLHGGHRVDTNYQLVQHKERTMWPRGIATQPPVFQSYKPKVDDSQEQKSLQPLQGQRTFSS